MKLKLKRVTALICAISMLATTAFTVLPGKQAEAAGSTQIVPEGLNKITFTDFGISNGSHVDAQYKQNTNITDFNGTLFHAKMTFPAMEATHLKVAGKSIDKGIELKVYRAADMDVIMLSDGTGAQAFSTIPIDSITENISFTGKEIDLKLTTQYVDDDGDGKTNDVKFGIWINDTLLQGKYQMFKNYADNLGNHLSLQLSGVAATQQQGVIVESVKKIPEELNQITFTDFGISNGSCVDAQYKQNTKIENFNGTLFHAKMTFPAMEATHLKVAGASIDKGIELKVYRVADMDVIMLMDGTGAQAFSAIPFDSITDNMSFTGKEIDLKLTTQYVDEDDDGQKNDVKFGIWINDTLLRNEYQMFKDYADNLGNHLSLQLSGVAATQQAGVAVESVERIPEGLKKITFSNFDINNGTYVEEQYKQNANITDFDGTLFHAKMTFPAMEATHLKVAGASIDKGIELKVYRIGDMDVIMLMDGTGAQAFSAIDFNSIDENMAFTGTEIDLKLTTQYVDKDGDNQKNDVQFGIWINDILLKGKYHIFKDYTDNLGNHLSLQLSGVANEQAIGVTVTSVAVPVVPAPPEPPVEPEVMPQGLTEITFRDFGIGDGTYSQMLEGEYDGNSLQDTVFHAKMKFAPMEATHFKIGGLTSDKGIELKVYRVEDMDVILLMDGTGAEAFSVIDFNSIDEDMAFTDTEIDIKLTIQYVDEDGDGQKNDVKFGVWINGTLLKNKYHLFKDYSVNLGNYLSLQLTGEAATQSTGVTLASVGEVIWETMPEGLTELTFRDFEIGDGLYTETREGQYEGESLNNTVISGKVTFSEEGDAFMMIGGKMPWGGIGLSTYNNQGTKVLRLYDTKHGESPQMFEQILFDANMAGVSLVGEELDLQISLQYVELDGDGKENDVKLGLWFGGRLYRNKYIYLNDYVDTNHSMGTWLTLVNMNNSSINVKSVGEVIWETMPEGLKELSFFDFGIQDGTYTDTVDGEYDGETLDGTLIKGKVTFSEKGDAFMMIGGKMSWGGIGLSTYDNQGTKVLRLYDTRHGESPQMFESILFDPNMAGVPLVGEELDLQISLQYVDFDADGKTDDVKLGVWFAGRLYRNRYIYLNDYVDTKHSMGNWLTFVNLNQSSIKLESVGKQVLQKLPEGLKVLSFNDFGIEDEFYSDTKDGSYTGSTLNGTVLKGTITFSEIGQAFLLYGGTESWGGFGLSTAKDVKTGETILRLFDTRKNGEEIKFPEYYFYSDIAGVPLVGQKLDLMISVQFVDRDKDGAEDDVKVGLWFGGKLYNNKYIYLVDYVHTKHSMGTWMTLVMFDNAEIIIGNPKPIDLSIFGLNENWKKTLLGTKFNSKQILSGYNPYTGDGANGIPWILISAIALGGIVISSRMMSKKRKETE